MKTYTLQKTVAQTNLDDLNHVNNVQYLYWVQEMAQLHWESVCEPEWAERYIWVVRSHHIEYFKPAVLGDVLELTTYVRESAGPISVRIVEFRKAGSPEITVSCTTRWCLLDADTFRPLRIPEDLAERFRP